ncbi:Uncharacterised protein [Bordetella pertussis]|nr:Uncharacterised protein [Bordetella pertussis]
MAPADVERPGAPAAIAAFGPVPRQSLPCQLGAWPQGLKQLAALRRRACWRISPPAEKIPPVPAGIMAPPRYG